MEGCTLPRKIVVIVKHSVGFLVLMSKEQYLITSKDHAMHPIGDIRYMYVCFTGPLPSLFTPIYPFLSVQFSCTAFSLPSIDIQDICSYI